MSAPARLGARSITAFLALLALIGLSIRPAAADDVVSFTDPDLQTCVNTTLGVGDGSAAITTTQATRVTTLVCASVGDLGGAEALTGLRKLTLTQAQELSSVAPLAGLPRLENLTIVNGAVTDLTPLQELPALTSLTLNTPDAKLADLSVVGTLTGLTSLALHAAGDFSGNALAPLSALTSLQDLYLTSNSIDDVEPLRALTALKHLELPSNKIADVEPLSGLPVLEYLSLSTNAVSDPNPLGSLSTLLQLQLDHNTIEDASGLAALPGLTYLQISYNKLADLEFVRDWDSLVTLTAVVNEVSDLSPLLGLPSLTYAGLSSNRIVDASALEGTPEAAYIWVSNQQVTLDDIAVGARQANPLIGIDGEVVLPTSTTATIDAADNSWTFATAQRNTLTWNVPIGTTGRAFSGTLTQVSVEQVEDVALTLTGSAVLAAGATGVAGDDVEYTFLLTNTGDVTLSDVTLGTTLVDLGGLTFDWPGAEGVLAPGERVTVTARHPLTADEVTAGSVVNTASATGTSPLGAEATADAVVTLALPEIAPDPDPDPTPDPEPAPDPDPIPDPTPNPEPTPEPTPTAPVTPSADPTPGPTAAATATKAAGTPTATGVLARTGLTTLPAALLSVVLLGAGAVALWSARRARQRR
ncbi:leucine-rich repeat domain-containing protein [Cellulomonas sp. RIT-PI-Y]|uniref:leucine-rich repeat domain-containing protein n=1 Tax=Cellulomonas sp. RIT-PI-Y TaxID=3035297 RepID=UPI0021DAAF7B|nr:leucine-rich repeat domain-containing protein [Cellulomonas sp. RIT-PI-Y]